MHWVHTVLMATAWGIAAAWVGKFLETARGLTRVPDLWGAEWDRMPEGEPRVAVIVPARNEEAMVGACLRSLVEQDYPRLRVIAVDDQSTDGTGRAIAEVAGRSEGRVEAIEVRELPAGWLGKTHAIACGARRAMDGEGCDFLLFTDADIEFERTTVRRALAFARETGADHFVLLPTTTTKTRGEAMLLAYLGVMSLWAIRPWRVADPRSQRDAIGVGAFNLLRAGAYTAIGGFEAIPMEIVEDLSLGRRVKRAGLRQGIATAAGMVCLHWAPGTRGIIEGMGKNVFAVFRFRAAALMVAAASMVVFCVGPAGFVWMRATRIPGLLALAAVAGLYGAWSRVSRIGWAYAVTFPVAAVVVVYAMLRSMVITLARRGVVWRGTFYELRELRRQAQTRL